MRSSLRAGVGYTVHIQHRTMKVFISWSGAASRAVAELLHTYLPCILQNLQPFVSSHDLASGARWAVQLSQELDDASFGIICLTPDNLHSDWILFEAGALTKHVENRACCLLLQNLGPADIVGPLAQFQNRIFSKDDFAKLVSDLNASLAAPLAPANLQLVFRQWWPVIEAAVHHELANAGTPAISTRREPLNILEELLVRVRNMQKDVESLTGPRTMPSETPIGDLASSGREKFRNYKPHFMIRLQAVAPELADLFIPFDNTTTFQALLDDLYMQHLKGHVPQASYGTTWVLRDMPSNKIIAHARMREDGTVEPGVRDQRKLSEVGITGSGALEAIPVSPPPNSA